MSKLITFDQFIEKYNGKYLEYNGDQYKFQCMDLFWAYLEEVLGIDPTPYRGWGSAKNCFNNFEKIRDASKYFTKIKNGPTNSPTKGSIVFWGTYLFVTGIDGHVAMCSGANAMSLIDFGQNYGKPNFCRFYNHSYKGVMGWLTPKK